MASHVPWQLARSSLVWQTELCSLSVLGDDREGAFCPTTQLAKRLSTAFSRAVNRADPCTLLESGQKIELDSLDKNQMPSVMTGTSSSRIDHAAFQCSARASTYEVSQGLVPRLVSFAPPDPHAATADRDAPEASPTAPDVLTFAQLTRHECRVAEVARLTSGACFWSANVPTDDCTTVNVYSCQQHALLESLHDNRHPKLGLLAHSCRQLNVRLGQQASLT